MTESIPITPSSWRQRIWSALARLPMWALVVFAILLLLAATAWGLLRPIIRERQAIQRLESYPDVKVLGGQFTTDFTYCGFATPPPPPPVWDQTIARITNGGTWQPDEISVYLKRETPVHALGELKSLRRIEDINLVGSQWADHELALVVGTFRFTRLSLIETQITAEGWATLRRAAFRELEVSGQPLCPEFFRVARNMPLLEMLWVEGKEITSDDLNRLAGHPNLNDLSLCDATLESDCMDVLATMPALKYVVLSGTRIDDSFLAELGRLKRLESLEIVGTNITDAGLAAIPASVHLELLNIDQTAITEVGLLSLKTIPKELSLVGTRVRITEPLKRWFLSHSFDKLSLDESQLDPQSPAAEELGLHVGYLDISPVEALADK